jgi:hypothetical protein
MNSCPAVLAYLRQTAAPIGGELRPAPMGRVR